MRLHFLALTSTVLALVSFAETTAAQDFMRLETTTQEEIDAKRAWVEEVEAQDFQFWRRYFSYMQRNPFSPPDAWYTPFRLVEGGLRPYLDIDTGSSTLDADALKAIEDYAFAGPTQSLIVYHDGAIRHQRFAEGFTPTEVIGSRSFSKTLVGIVTGFALAEGAIESLDQPISTWLEEWAEDPRGAITLRQLLNNTSGLEIVQPSIDPMNKSMQLIEGTDVVTAALAYELEAEPGTRFVHENANTQLAAIVLERATGVAYADYVSTRLWQPLGAQTGGVRLDRIDDGTAIALCCFRASVSDWMRIGHMLMNDGVVDGERILPEGWVDEMLTGSEVNPNYGLQIWIGQPYVEDRRYLPFVPGNRHSEPFLAEDLFYLDGGGNMRLWIVPSEDLMIFRYGDPMESFDEAFIPNTILRSLEDEG